MQKSKIEWTQYTSNPIRGKCLHGCPYCYAERMRQRFKQPEELSFHPEELRSIERRQKPATIFVGSMYDIFGEWVPSKYIHDIMNTAIKCPQHSFIFLTKNPSRYNEFCFPENCWRGCSVDGTKAMTEQMYFEGRKNTFVSFEPLLSVENRINLSEFGSVIIGAMTGPRSIKPILSDVKWLIHASGDKPVFLKNNLLYLFPGLPKRQETAWPL